MKRRKFVAASGATLIAGCNEIQNADPEDPPNSTEDVPKREDKSEEAPAGDIVIQQSEWDVEGEASQFLLTNVGDAPAGPVTVVSRWFDSNENYVGYDQTSVPVLTSQDTWFVQIESSAPFEVSRFDGYVEFDSRYPTDDLSVELVEVEQERPMVTGIVTPDRDTETTIRAVALTYNSGWVTHTGQFTDGHIPQGTDWRFSIPLSQVDAEESSIGDEVATIFTVL